MNHSAASFVVLCFLGLSWNAAARAEVPYGIAWSRQFGTATTSDESFGVAVDAASNAYIGGSTSGNLSGAEATEGFLTKYDRAGNLLWSRLVGTSGLEAGSSVAVDAIGNAYIAGFTDGTLGGPNAGADDAFLVKYDGAGNVIWSRQAGSTASDVALGVAVDVAGNAYISGDTYGNLAGTNAGDQDAFLVKYDAAGNLLWSRQVGTATTDYSYGVAVDGSGDAYVIVDTFGSLGGPNAGSYDALLSKYDTAGNLLWSRQIGTAEYDTSRGVAVDSSGNAYICGYTLGNLGSKNAGSSDAFVTKFDSAGNLLWTRQLGTTKSDESLGVAVDAAGNAYISGWTSGSLGAPNSGNDDAFLAKYDAAGNFLWSRQIGTTNNDDSRGVAVTAFGDAYITGYSAGGLGGPNRGSFDAFLIKFSVPETSSFILASVGMLFLIVVAGRARRRRAIHATNRTVIAKSTIDLVSPCKLVRANFIGRQSLRSVSTNQPRQNVQATCQLTGSSTSDGRRRRRRCPRARLRSSAPGSHR
jgi:hypothetical protein